MQHSAIYLSMLNDGKVLGVRETILKQGEARFGVPPEAARRRLESITNLEVLQDTALRMLTAESWEELLPAPKKPSRRKTR